MGKVFFLRRWLHSVFISNLSYLQMWLPFHYTDVPQGDNIVIIWNLSNFKLQIYWRNRDSYRFLCPIIWSIDRIHNWGISFHHYYNIYPVLPYCGLKCNIKAFVLYIYIYEIFSLNVPIHPWSTSHRVPIFSLALWRRECMGSAMIFTSVISYWFIWLICRFGWKIFISTWLTQLYPLSVALQPIKSIQIIESSIRVFHSKTLFTSIS